MTSSNGDDSRGLNLRKFPGRLRQYRRKDPDEMPDEAREVYDPHTWDDPDPSRRERLTPDTTAGWLVAAIVFLGVGGVALYLLPIIGPTYRNDRLLIAIGIIGAVVVFHLWSRQQGFQAAATNFDKSIIYYGDEIDVRLGEYKGTDGRSDLFTPYVNVSYGGFNARPLKKRDLPFDPARLRANIGRKDEVGETPVVDRLNATTAKAETETAGTVLVTHAESIEFDGFGRESDRFTTRPQVIDEDIAADMNRLIDSLERSVETLRQQLTMVEERAEDLRETRRDNIVDELRGALSLMEQMAHLAAIQNRSRRDGEDFDAGRTFGRNGHDPVEAIEKDIEEELGEM